MDLVCTKVYYYEERFAPTNHIEKNSCCVSSFKNFGLETNKDNLFLNLQGEIQQSDLNPIHYQIENSSIKDLLVRNIFVDSKFLEWFQDTKFSNVQTIWCDDATVPESQILHEVFYFLEAIYLKNGHLYRKIPFKNKYLEKSFDNVENSETILTTDYFPTDKRYKNLTFDGVTFDNSTIIRLSEIIAPGCNLTFFNCDLLGLDFEFEHDSVDGGDASKIIWWHENVMSSFSSLHLESLNVNFGSISSDFRKNWYKTIATRKVYIQNIDFGYYDDNGDYSHCY